tara:strand:- start:3121 stop:3993 length:873 start_codon:yes stop_codon:yes gene_type:complete
MTSLVKYDDSYLARLSDGSSEELDSLEGEVSKLDLMPRLILPRDGTKDVKCVLGEDTLFTRRKINAIVVWAGARRTLWPPEGADREDNSPICTTGVVDMSTFNRRNDTGVGKWIVAGNEEFVCPVDSASMQTNVHCSSCAYNEFGSAALWDESKSGNAGKACNESRVLALRIVDQVDSFPTSSGEQYGLFNMNGESPIVICNLPATSIKSVRKMCMFATSRRIPLSKIVWSLGAEIVEKGSIQWSVLEARHAGFPVEDMLLGVAADRSEVRSLFLGESVDVIDVDDEIPF